MKNNRIKMLDGRGGILFVFLLLLLLATNSFLWPHGKGAGGLHTNYPGVLLFHFIFLPTLLMLLFNKSTLIRKGSDIFLFSVLFMDISYLLITGSSFGSYDAINMVNNSHYAGLAAASFITKFIGAFIITGVCFVFIHVIRGKSGVTFLPKHAIVPVLTAAFFSFYAVTHTDTADTLPSPFRVPLNLSLAYIEAHKPVKERNAVFEKASHPQVKHVFLVVDESITGSSLSINGANLGMTPYLNRHQDSIINFGIASSFTNYSAGSNICMISGLRQKQLPDNGQLALRQPSLFQYAKAAGYKTYYIDAQTIGGILQNFLTKFDRNFIDVFLQPADRAPEIPLYERDVVVSKILTRLAKTNEKSFVFVNKTGAHWPYFKSHPHEAQPQYGGFKNLKTDYQRAVTWSVDNFWERMINGITTKDSCTVIYTSDHGEYIDETGYTAAGHGRLSNPDPMEGNVPLLVYDRSGLKHGFNVRKNKASQEQIFPTALLLMGFSNKYVFSRYGPSLFQEPEQCRRWFLSGDVFGRSRTYKTYLD
jgi:lipid A ethanolaminephosphotransferase